MNYFIYDQCLLRISTHPVEKVLAFFNDTKELDLQDGEKVLLFLKQLYSDELFKKAMLTSSKEIHEFIEQIITTCDNIPNIKDDKLVNLRKALLTATNYFIRMCSRSTPYGLFAGTAYLNINAGSTALKFNKNRFKIHTQLNLFAVTKLVRELDFRNSTIFEKVLYHTNNTLYKKGNRYFFVEQLERNGFSSSRLTSIISNEYTSAVVNEAAKGMTLKCLVEKLPITDITIERKVDFIYRLVKSQFLVSDLIPSTSTDSFISDLLRKLQQYGLAELHSQIKSVNDKLLEASEIDFVTPDRLYFGNNSLFPTTKDLIKSDLHFNLEKRNINKRIIEEICQTSYELMHFAPLERKSKELDVFIKKFHDKYEAKMVPMCEALDATHGIGYGLMATGIAEFMPLLENVLTTSTEGNTQLATANHPSVLVQEVYKDYLRHGKSNINVETYLGKFGTKEDKLAPPLIYTSTAIFGSVIANSSAELDQLSFKFVPVLSHSPGATRMLTRFANGESEISLLAKKIASDEQRVNPNSILAEVTTIPDGKYANITLTPILREYEIPYNASSNLNEVGILNINDLSVTVRDGKVLLWSIKHGKAVIPCFSNSYNIRKATPLLQFLADVSIQSLRFGYDWQWGNYMQEAHLPRIEYKNFILCRERWIIKSHKTTHSEINTVREYVDKIRKEINIPRYVVISEGDNELLMDLDNALCLATLSKELSQRDVIVYEYIYSPDKCIIRDDTGSYASTLLIAMGTERAMPIGFLGSGLPTTNELPRAFAPGTEWLYVKIYSGNKILETLLGNIILPFAENLLKEGAIDKWFYIRYNDPDSHLRIRFHKAPTSARWNDTLFEFSKAINEFIDDEFAVRITADTYYREIERYGEQNMVSCESLFHADSTAVSRFTSLISGDEGELLRWYFALVNVSIILEDFAYTLKEKYDLVNDLSNSFLSEFSSGDKGRISLVKSLNTKYRNYRKQIENLFQSQQTEEAHNELYTCFADRSKDIKILIPKFISLPKDIRDPIIKSIIHMSMNRTFLSNQRKHELVIYYFLATYYKSKIKKNIVSYEN